MTRTASDVDLVAVARSAIEAHLHGRPRPHPPQVGRRAAVFVTIRLGGELRGCIGTMTPLHSDLGEEVADRAVSAAREDPRFPPLTPDEWPRCHVEVSVLGPLREVTSTGTLDPKCFGVEVRDRLGRTGVLLPDLPGVDTPAQQLSIARRKAGIPAEVPITIRRFRVEKHAESSDASGV